MGAKSTSSNAMGIKSRPPKKVAHVKRKISKDNEEIEMESPEDIFGEGGSPDGGFMGALGEMGGGGGVSFRI